MGALGWGRRASLGFCGLARPLHCGSQGMFSAVQGRSCWRHVGALGSLQLTISPTTKGGPGPVVHSAKAEEPCPGLGIFKGKNHFFFLATFVDL